MHRPTLVDCCCILVDADAGIGEAIECVESHPAGNARDGEAGKLLTLVGSGRPADPSPPSAHSEIR